VVVAETSVWNPFFSSAASTARQLSAMRIFPELGLQLVELLADELGDCLLDGFGHGLGSGDLHQPLTRRSSRIIVVSSGRAGAGPRDRGGRARWHRPKVVGEIRRRCSRASCVRAVLADKAVHWLLLALLPDANGAVQPVPAVPVAPVPSRGQRASLM
jgi:hypothetical protein